MIFSLFLLCLPPLLLIFKNLILFWCKHSSASILCISSSFWLFRWISTNWIINWPNWWTILWARQSSIVHKLPLSLLIIFLAQICIHFGELTFLSEWCMWRWSLFNPLRHLTFTSILRSKSTVIDDFVVNFILDWNVWWLPGNRIWRHWM